MPLNILKQTLYLQKSVHGLSQSLMVFVVISAKSKHAFSDYDIFKFPFPNLLVYYKRYEVWSGPVGKVLDLESKVC